MPNICNLGKAPKKVMAAVSAVRKSLEDILGKDLVGIYLYGSLAFECFNPKTSDIDLVVIVKEKLTEEQSQKLFDLHKKMTELPNEYGKKLEIVFYELEIIESEAFPTPFVFCFSHDTCKIPTDETDMDTDFPMLRQHLRDFGVALTGPDPEELFKPVPWNLLEASIVEDIVKYIEKADKFPVYSILNLCRAFYSLSTHVVSISKIQGGEWAMENFPEEFRPTIKTALGVYVDQPTDERISLLLDNIETFTDYCRVRLATL